MSKRLVRTTRYLVGITNAVAVSVFVTHPVAVVVYALRVRSVTRVRCIRAVVASISYLAARALVLVADAVAV